MLKKYPVLKLKAKEGFWFLVDKKSKRQKVDIKVDIDTAN